MKEFFKQYWKEITAGVVILLILIYIYYQGKKSGQKPTTKKPPADIIGGAITPEKQAQLEGLAVSLYEDMSGLNLTGHKSSLYFEVSKLSNNELATLSNLFNFYYETDSGETFKEWLNNETFTVGLLAGTVNGILLRLSDMGIS